VCCVGAKFSSVVHSSRRSVAPGARLPGARSTLSLASCTPIYGLPIPTTSVGLPIPTSSCHEENSTTRPVCCTLCIHLTRPAKRAGCCGLCLPLQIVFCAIPTHACLGDRALVDSQPLVGFVAPSVCNRGSSSEDRHTLRLTVTRAIFNQLLLWGMLGVLLLLSVLHSARQLHWLLASRSPRISVLLLSPDVSEAADASRAADWRTHTARCGSTIGCCFRI
jgi:hypothetical protein